MRADLRPLADKAQDALCAMPFVPDIELLSSHEAEKRGPVAAPYDNRPDKDRWWALFFKMLGTRQAAVVTMFLRQLQQLVPDKWVVVNGKGEWAGNEDDVRAMFGMIQSMRPKTVAEAALAAQLVALHFHAMKLGAGMSSYSMGDARTAATQARLARAYAEGLLTLQKLQGKARKSKQTIKVETHHHHHQHVHLEGGGSNFGGRPQGTDGSAFIQIPALPSPNQAGSALPVPSRKDQARLSDARGSKGRRRPAGRG